jgi:hypothetical protein
MRNFFAVLFGLVSLSVFAQDVKFSCDDRQPFNLVFVNGVWK